MISLNSEIKKGPANERSGPSFLLKPNYGG